MMNARGEPVLSVLVVDDDARVARNHRDLVESVPGFRVVAVTHTGDETLRSATKHQPDLVLLDLYLPDVSGLDVLQRLRAPGGPDLEVLVITALRDLDNVRAALHGGAIYYLIKPFNLAALREQLDRFAALREQLTGVQRATQRDVDRVFGVHRPLTRTSLPKGLTPETAHLVTETLRVADSHLSAVEVAKRAGIARVTARRYLEHLCADGQAELHMRYGSAGRPEHRYEWVR